MKITQTTHEEKITALFEDFEVLLKEPAADHSKIMEQAKKIVMLLMHSGAKADKGYALSREDEIWVRVHEVKGTFNSKTALVLTCISGGLTILGGLANFATFIPGTPLGNTLAEKGLSFLSGADAGKNIKNAADGFGQFGQAVGMFPNIANEVAQAERTEANAWLEEAKQKRQDRKDSHREQAQKVERALQQSREELEKESRIKSEIMRG